VPQGQFSGVVDARNCKLAASSAATTVEAAELIRR
jgi:hypothetical protein